MRIERLNGPGSCMATARTWIDLDQGDVKTNRPAGYVRDGGLVLPVFFGFPLV